MYIFTRNSQILGSGQQHSDRYQGGEHCGHNPFLYSFGVTVPRFAVV